MSQLESKCPVMATRLQLEHFYNDDSKDGMCSKCHPCKLGLYDAIKIFEAIQARKGTLMHFSQLRRIAVDVKDGKVAVAGWTETSAVDPLELAARVKRLRGS